LRPAPATSGPVADGLPRPLPHQPVAHRPVAHRPVAHRPVPVVPVLLHRAEPVRPRLVAGREFRLAGDPPARPPAPRRPRLAPVPDGPAAADTGGADDEAIEDLDRPPARRVRRRTG
ncbi:MAG: hypothetical protein NTW05_00880, partial [Pseudonocardiales bacterium]|nr:hypothetical protein [Pseudonocardiales bacterium]